jgi:hypothetical protein
MAILNKLTWIDSSALTGFILSAQVRCVDTSFSHPAAPGVLFVCFFVSDLFL